MKLLAVCLVAAGLAVAAVFGGYAVWPEHKPPTPIPLLSNDDFLDALGTVVQIVPGCPFFSGEATGFNTYIFMDQEATQENVRIVAVCAPEQQLEPLQ